MDTVDTTSLSRTSSSLTPAREYLQRFFGFREFRPLQEDIISHVMQKKDAVVLMPTGGGKSLCYQLPALLSEGITVVISPLIALMKDQVDALRLNGIAAAYLNSTLTARQQTKVLDNVVDRKYKLLYIAPERLFYDYRWFLDFLAERNVSLFAIDEAHCISQWGHDFRPEYRQLAELKKAFPQTPVIALTATADKLTRKDIVEKLELQDHKVFVSSFNRPNIIYYVQPKQNSFQQLTQFLHRHQNESGIIYCLTRNSTELLADNLCAEGFSALPYHAGLEKDERDKNQELFIKDKVKIICATIAFGMGIDKSNVRFVVHNDLPKNIESYYQETGRAGRDGLKSEALLFFGYGDVFRLKGFCEIENNPEQTGILLRKLDQMVQYAQLRQCRRKYLLNYFGEEHPGNCGSCDICLSQEEKFDGTELARKALSAVARLEQRFGTSYIIDFLKGSRSKKIWNRHKNLKTFGVGADLTQEEWRNYLNELIALGYLDQAGSEYPVLKLNENSWKVLKGQEKVMLTQSITMHKSTIGDLDYEKPLFEELRQLRMQLAEKEGVPAFVVMHDSTLVDLATRLPQSISDLPLITGFGQRKIEKYGDQFVEMINAYCTKHSLESKMKQAAVKIRRPRSGTGRSSTETSYQLFREGKSVEDIANERGLLAGTIISHLCYHVTDGKIRPEELIEPQKVKPIENAINAHGRSSLKAIREALGEAYSYDEIRVVLCGMEAREVNQG